MNPFSQKSSKLKGIFLVSVILFLAFFASCSRIAPLAPGYTEVSDPVPVKPTESRSTSLRPEVINHPEGRSNRLISENSPYLQQHAYDPVDWYPWGSEAFEKARLENKPVFLSIGYSTCHWCHVMKEETFSDPEVARMMNEVFVNILVDREERPDIDSIYSNVAVSMNGTSGWPLNVMMTSDQKPFYIETYIPKESQFGRVGMVELISQLKTAWENQNDELLDIAGEVAEEINRIASTSRRGELEMDRSLLDKTYQGLERQFDLKNGGFGTEPKFPAPHRLLFLLRYWRRTGEKHALEMVETSLQAMRRGGVYDQLGYGFHRYTIDAAWQKPHFEKMVYDQALLALAYTEAYQVTGKPEYAQAAHEIFAYVLRDMSAPAGVFYAAEDSDSDGKEGGFYLWTVDEIRSILNEQDAELIIKAFNITDVGNYTDQNQGLPSGQNVLYFSEPASAIAADLGIPEADLVSRLEAARQQLFSARNKRFALHRDEKILTAWNGLMIAAFARAGQVYNDQAYTRTAQNAADFIQSNLRGEDGRLLHRYPQDKGDLLRANVDDYAYLVWGLIELYEATFEVNYLEYALRLNQELLDHFWDEGEGGFYFTPEDGEDLLVRQKISKDRDLPSGNSVAMLNLLRLSRMTANHQLEEKAAGIPQAFGLQIEGAPSDYSLMMSAVDFAVGPSYEVVIAGDPSAADTQAMLSALRQEFIPNKVVLLRPPGDSPEIVRLAEYLQFNKSRNGQSTAYVCLDYYCELPTTDISQMLELLE